MTKFNDPELISWLDQYRAQARDQDGFQFDDPTYVATFRSGWMSACASMMACIVVDSRFDEDQTSAFAKIIQHTIDGGEAFWS